MNRFRRNEPGMHLSANEFLDQLARRWVREAIDDLEQSAASAIRAEVAESFRAIKATLGSIGAAGVLRWCRRAALGQQVGTSVMLGNGLKQLLIAFAVLASEAGGDDVTVRGPSALEVGNRRIEALITCKLSGANRVRSRAYHRAVELANQNVIGESATFLVSGVVLGPLTDDPDPELDMTIGPTDREDLVAGSSAVRLSFISASEKASAA